MSSASCYVHPRNRVCVWTWATSHRNMRNWLQFSFHHHHQVMFLHVHWSVCRTLVQTWIEREEESSSYMDWKSCGFVSSCWDINKDGPDQSFASSAWRPTMCDLKNTETGKCEGTKHQTVGGRRERKRNFCDVLIWKIEMCKYNMCFKEVLCSVVVTVPVMVLQLM